MAAANSPSSYARRAASAPTRAAADPQPLALRHHPLGRTDLGQQVAGVQVERVQPEAQRLPRPARSHRPGWPAGSAARSAAAGRRSRAAAARTRRPRAGPRPRGAPRPARHCRTLDAATCRLRMPAARVASGQQVVDQPLPVHHPAVLHRQHASAARGPVDAGRAQSTGRPATVSRNSPRQVSRMPVRRRRGRQRPPRTAVASTRAAPAAPSRSARRRSSSDLGRRDDVARRGGRSRSAKAVAQISSTGACSSRGRLGGPPQELPGRSSSCPICAYAKPTDAREQAARPAVAVPLTVADQVGAGRDPPRGRVGHQQAAACRPRAIRDSQDRPSTSADRMISSSWPRPRRVRFAQLGELQREPQRQPLPRGRRPARPGRPRSIADAPGSPGQQQAEPADQAGGRHGRGSRTRAGQQPELAGQPDASVAVLGAGRVAARRSRQPGRGDRPLVGAAGPEVRIVQQRLGLPEGRHRLGDPPVPPQPAGARHHQPGVVGQRAGQARQAHEPVVVDGQRRRGVLQQPADGPPVLGPGVRADGGGGLAGLLEQLGTARVQRAGRPAAPSSSTSSTSRWVCSTWW